MEKEILHNYKSKNFDNRENNTKIKYIILHYTETKNLLEAINLLCSNSRKVSSHYIVNLDGKIYRLVEDSKRAWHAGVSSWGKDININNLSIGIEIVYEGEVSKKKYTKAQIKSLIFLIKLITKKYNIKGSNILGHSDIAPTRKIDPGIFFPWKELAKNQIGVWFESKNSHKKKLKLDNEEFSLFLMNLKIIGYKVKVLNEKINYNQKSINDNQKSINAFHRRYIPKLINKKPSHESLLVSEKIIKLTSSR